VHTSTKIGIPRQTADSAVLSTHIAYFDLNAILPNNFKIEDPWNHGWDGTQLNVIDPAAWIRMDITVKVFRSNPS
jgi:hypothetical protein